MKVAVVGTGVIGSGWITRMLAHGNEVIATDQVKAHMRECWRK